MATWSKDVLITKFSGVRYFSTPLLGKGKFRFLKYDQFVSRNLSSLNFCGLS